MLARDSRPRGLGRTRVKGGRTGRKGEVTEGAESRGTRVEVERARGEGRVTEGVENMKGKGEYTRKEEDAGQ